MQTYVDNEGIPTNVLTKSVGGCAYRDLGQSVSSDTIPNDLSNACSTGASDFKFEWLD